MNEKEFSLYKFSVTTRVKVNSVWHKVSDIDFPRGYIGIEDITAPFHYKDIEDIKK